MGWPGVPSPSASAGMTMRPVKTVEWRSGRIVGPGELLP
jgi:hypothetical protein